MSESPLIRFINAFGLDCLSVIYSSWWGSLIRSTAVATIHIGYELFYSWIWYFLEGKAFTSNSWLFNYAIWRDDLRRRFDEIIGRGDLAISNFRLATGDSRLDDLRFDSFELTNLIFVTRKMKRSESFERNSRISLETSIGLGSDWARTGGVWTGV